MPSAKKWALTIFKSWRSAWPGCCGKNTGSFGQGVFASSGCHPKTVEIAIIAGKVEGKPVLNVARPARINQKFLQSLIGRVVTEGNLIRIQNVERAVLLMDNLPGVSAHADMEEENFQGLPGSFLMPKKGRLPAAPCRSTTTATVIRAPSAATRSFRLMILLVSATD